MNKKKILISEKLLSELNISDKNLHKYVARGAYQYAFNSDDPDKIIKFGRIPAEIDGGFIKRTYNEMELEDFAKMQKHPDLFCKIFKITKNYVILEKLDANLAKEHYAAIQKELIKNFQIKFNALLFEFAIEQGDETKMMEYFVEAHKFLQSKLPINLITAYYKFMTLVLKIYNLGEFDYADVKAGNFGYDKKGNLKMIDI